MPNDGAGMKRGWMRTGELRERWGDSLLTVLTILILVMMFVVAPLQALGLFEFQIFELFLALFLVGGVFLMSGSAIAVTAMLVALAMIVTGGILRLRSPSIARARRWRRRKTFSREGPTWRAMRSSQARSGRSKGLRPLSRKMRPAG